MADMTTEAPAATKPGQDLTAELRGGEYFFIPSLSALRWLADLH
jgi:hypothetical protein